MINIRGVVLSIILTLTSYSAIARTSLYLPQEVKDKTYSEDFHLFGGIGANTLIHHAEDGKEDLGVGLSLVGRIDYDINELWSIDVGSHIRFNDTTGNIIWDTLINAGVRRNFPLYYSKSLGLPYLRLNVGQGPTSIYVDNESAETIQKQYSLRSLQPSSLIEDNEINITKFIAYSNTYGVSIGFIHTDNDLNYWFSEFGVTYQNFYKVERIKMVNDVPEVVGQAEDNLTNNAVSISWTIGYRFF